MSLQSAAVAVFAAAFGSVLTAQSDIRVWRLVNGAVGPSDATNSTSVVVDNLERRVNITADASATDWFIFQADGSVAPHSNNSK
jgi:hypothetical protein